MFYWLFERLYLRAKIKIDEADRKQLEGETLSEGIDRTKGVYLAEPDSHAGMRCNQKILTVIREHTQLIKNTAEPVDILVHRLCIFVVKYYPKLKRGFWIRSKFEVPSVK